LCVSYADEIIKLQGSRESSPSARKKEKPRKLFHESATKSAGVLNQSDPGTVDSICYFINMVIEEIAAIILN
jgi:hypothetical protein